MTYLFSAVKIALIRRRQYLELRRARHSGAFRVVRNVIAVFFRCKTVFRVAFAVDRCAANQDALEHIERWF